MSASQPHLERGFAPVGVRSSPPNYLTVCPLHGIQRVFASGIRPVCVSVAFDGVSLNNHHLLTRVLSCVSNCCMTKATQELPSPKKKYAERIKSARKNSGFKAKLFENHATDDSDLLADDYEYHAYCPTCGRANPIIHSPEWLLNRFSGIMGRIIAALIEARRHNKPLSSREMQDAAYSTSADGPPSNAPTVIRETITKKRNLLWECGWDIVGPHVTGLGYQLVPLVEPT